MSKDYLDELIEGSMQDPEFAAAWPAIDAALKFQELRVAAGLTQQQVADRMGVARPRVAEIEKDPAGVSFKRISAYAAAIGAAIRIEAPKTQPATKTPKKVAKKKVLSV